MSKDELIEPLKCYFETCKELQRKISSIDAIQIANKELKSEVDLFASKWFNEYSKRLLQFGISENIVDKYNNAFKTLLKLSGNNNRKSSYITQFDIICKSFREDIILFMQIDAIEPEPIENGLNKDVYSLLDKVLDKEENEYLAEALGCWENKFLKAAVVLAWCAAMDRIHKVIEQIGFEVFNKTSEKMKAETKGRFKNFNKNQNVQSLSDLRMVFDSDILWILEGMKMIDSNQKTRLSSCFDMRCHSGHPGAAPITPYNVLSCFSDIIEIILANPIFSLSKAEDTIKE